MAKRKPVFSEQQRERKKENSRRAAQRRKAEHAHREAKASMRLLELLREHHSART